MSSGLVTLTVSLITMVSDKDFPISHTIRTIEWIDTNDATGSHVELANE